MRIRDKAICVASILGAILMIVWLSGCKDTEAPEVVTVEDVTEATVLEAPAPEIYAEPEVRYTNSGLKISHAGFVYTDEIPMSNGYQMVMQQACRMYGVDYALALAVAEVESDFDPEAWSGWAFGIMQVSPVNYDWIMEETGLDASDKVYNVAAGVYMLGDLLERYDTVTQALMCYNHGEAGARQLWAEGVWQTEYTQKVLEAAGRWEDVVT